MAPRKSKVSGDSIGGGTDRKANAPANSGGHAEEAARRHNRRAQRKNQQRTWRSAPGLCWPRPRGKDDKGG